MSKKVEKVDDKFPAAFVISRQLDQEKINFLTKRIEELLSSNNVLRTSSSQNERDTHDIVLYFQREMEMKDEIILKLNEELVKCQTQLKFEVERVKKSCEQELTEIKFTSERTITELSSRLASVEADLKSIEIFRQEKDQHEGTILALEKKMQSQREQLIDSMEEQERKFLEEKSHLFKDLDEQKASFRELALKEARSAMGEEAKKILADNNRLFEELKFHHLETADYQIEKVYLLCLYFIIQISFDSIVNLQTRLVTELTTTKREVEILTEKEMEYAKQGFFKGKEIKALKER
jgi:hypothetical protein